MLVASVCLLVLGLSVLLRATGRKRPLDSMEVLRLRRFSEKLQREASMPFE
jgi:hypothetical protein